MGGRLGRQRLGALEQAQPGADDLARGLVAAGGDEALDEAAQFGRQGGMEAVAGWHGAQIGGAEGGCHLQPARTVREGEE